MIEVGDDKVMLPIDDSGKAIAPVPDIKAGMSRSRSRNLLPVVLALGLVTAVGLCFQTVLQLLIEPTLPTSTSSSDPTGGLPSTGGVALDVVALGRLVPNGKALSVGLPNGAGDARIERLLVSEGEQVSAGQVLAELDNLPQLLAMRVSAESTLAAQEAALEQVRASSSASLAEARANRASAQATLLLANQELARQVALDERNLTARTLLEQAQSTAVKAAAELSRTSALVERYRGVDNGTQPDIVLAARNLDLARANLARANQDLTSARVVAPQAGTVLEIHARVGEKPSDSGVMTIGDLTQMTAELEVYQTDIRKVVLGQVALMTAPALSMPLAGKVAKIGQIVGRQSEMSTEPAANADARVVLVTVTLDEESSALAFAYTNLEVVGRIRANAK